MRIRIAFLATAVLAATAAVQAGDEIDLDRWHERLALELGEDHSADEEEGVPALGFYPAVGAALGPPNWMSLQASAYLSFTNGKKFSIYGGYGHEWGPRADAQIVTVGWGGVENLYGASKARGFHGKFLRYRRWDDEDHGIHHGISFGTESGAGFLALAFEVGAARSSRDHWLFTAQVALKVAMPVRIPLRRRNAERE